MITMMSKISEAYKDVAQVVGVVHPDAIYWESCRLADDVNSEG